MLAFHKKNISFLFTTVFFHIFAGMEKDKKLYLKDNEIYQGLLAYARYEQIAAEMENYQYTKEESERIGEMEGECVGYFMKSAINSMDGFKSELKGFFMESRKLLNSIVTFLCILTK